MATLGAQENAVPVLVGRVNVLALVVQLASAHGGGALVPMRMYGTKDRIDSVSIYARRKCRLAGSDRKFLQNCMRAAKPITSAFLREGDDDATTLQPTSCTQPSRLTPQRRT